MATKPPSQTLRARHIAGASSAGWIVAATFLALLALTTALIAAFLNSTSMADNLARQEERRLVERYLERNQNQLVSANKLQLTWDEAVVKLNAPDAEAWARNFLAGYFWGSHRIDRIFHVRFDGEMVRCWREANVSKQCQFDTLAPTVSQLLRKSLHDETGQASGAQRKRLGSISWPVNAKGVPLSLGASSVAMVEGRPAIVAAAAVVPDVSPAMLSGPPDYIVLVRFIDARVLFDLQDAGMPDDRNGLAVHDLNGGLLGWISWQSKTPGPAILRQTAPLLAIYILFFVGVVAGGAIIVRRMRRTTSELVASEAQAQHNALHDAMSGLPNRAHFMQRLRQQLADCTRKRGQGDVFVAYVDIDRFKVVNDTLGHHVGDELVRQMALRLRRSLPPGDFLSRFGGDEFVLMRRSSGGASAADMLGRQIMAVAREPFVISGNNLEITLSCGISWGPEQSEDPGELLRRADIALYRAKQRGRARYRRFTRDMDASVKLRREMEMELRRAIARDELALAYQPIVNAASGAVEGFEALLRWPHPERGMIRPGLFVPVAEQAGMMMPLGNWVLRRVFKECR
ncbi:MAG: bifunctional diguanylate cyclase/phosphodiesterase, partial [Novosphingobium sp.]